MCMSIIFSHCLTTTSTIQRILLCKADYMHERTHWQWNGSNGTQSDDDILNTFPSLFLRFRLLHASLSVGLTLMRRWVLAVLLTTSAAGCCKLLPETRYGSVDLGSLRIVGHNIQELVRYVAPERFNILEIKRKFLNKCVKKVAENALRRRRTQCCCDLILEYFWSQTHL